MSSITESGSFHGEADASNIVSRARKTVDLLKTYTDFRERRYYLTRGEINNVLLTQGAESVVVKMPKKESQSNVLFESFIVDLVSEGTAPPLAVPSLIDCQSSYPQHAVFSKIEGEVLSKDTVRQFSLEEKRVFGRKVGEFVAWLPTVISPETYAEIEEESGMKHYDRFSNLKWYNYVGRRYGDILSPLDEILTELAVQYKSLRDTPALDPTIIGHEDVRLANMAFVYKDGLWQPNGVFDFGLTKPSTPERELRHMPPLGKEITEAAIEGYEGATGQKISREMLRFWADVQYAPGCLRFLTSGNTMRTVEFLKDLKTFHPEKEW